MTFYPSSWFFVSSLFLLFPSPTLSNICGALQKVKHINIGRSLSFHSYTTYLYNLESTILFARL